MGLTNCGSCNKTLNCSYQPCIIVLCGLGNKTTWFLLLVVIPGNFPKCVSGSDLAIELGYSYGNIMDMENSLGLLYG